MFQPVTVVQDADLVLSSDDLIWERRGYILDLGSTRFYGKDSSFDLSANLCFYPLSLLFVVSWL